eukprot:5829287-Pyramimonas_sp.AAC.1
MRQTDASDVCESTPLITSPVAPYSPSQVQKTDSTSQDDSNNTNSFADLGRAADRVQSSGFDRRTRLMSPTRLL